MSPPGSPGGQTASINSSNLTAKQYFCVNLSKFIIELIGTSVFTMLFYMMNGRYSSVLLSLWVITLFGMNISGAHYNPCITIAQMIRKTSSFGSRRRRLLGLMYIIA
jgi:glycerol uptake facilitator-like aquaporin